MDDVMGLSMGSFAEDEACSGVKSTVRQWRDDHAGVLELVRYATSAACLSPSGWRQRTLESTAQRVRASSWPRSSVLRHRRRRSSKSGLCVVLEQLAGELLECDAEAQRWAVELSEGGSIRVRAPNLALLSRDDCPPSLHAVVMLSRGKIQESGTGRRRTRRCAR
jgi:hypothetical protein